MFASGPIKLRSPIADLYAIGITLVALASLLLKNTFETETKKIKSVISVFILSPGNFNN